jgi:hypothetical protein
VRRRAGGRAGGAPRGDSVRVDRVDHVEHAAFRRRVGRALRRFGITFAVPPDFHVIGDAELAARIGASATPHLQSDLRKRAEAKKGIPLLALSKDDMNVTLSVVVVPADAQPLELAQHQQEVMSANLAGFEVTSAAADHAQDGVPGAEMSTRYVVSSSGGDKTRVASRMRLFVRDGIATLVTAVWPESSAHADQARALLDGLRFQPTH